MGYGYAPGYGGGYVSGAMMAPGAGSYSAMPYEGYPTMYGGAGYAAPMPATGYYGGSGTLYDQDRRYESQPRGTYRDTTTEEDRLGTAADRDRESSGAARESNRTQPGRARTPDQNR